LQLTKVGRNKLVSTKKTSTAFPDPAQSSHKASNSTIKRVQIASSNETTNEQTSSEKTLTKFSYREISSKPKCKPTSIVKQRPMGLVRVNPSQFTPVCPSIFKGVLCTDETCTKRHDVSRQSVTPMCTFYQRNGSCMRADNCKFRHVKLNSNAGVCAHFKSKGFCENVNCTDLHVWEWMYFICLLLKTILCVFCTRKALWSEGLLLLWYLSSVFLFDFSLVSLFFISSHIIRKCVNIYFYLCSLLNYYFCHVN